MTIMNEMLLYTIKSAFVLAILYVPYTLLLREEDFFRFNRITLLGILVLSMILPLCNISSLSLDNQPIVHTAQQQMIEIGIPVMQVVDETGEEPHEHGSMSWFQTASLIYLLGVLAVLCLRLIQFAKMGMEIRGGTLWRAHDDGAYIHCHANPVASYSWFGNIVISKEDYDRHGREIVMHEKGHIRCLHSLDILLLTFVEMLQWWNPLVYMLGVSLRDVHEYEADDYVLNQGIPLRDYQNLLIRKAVGASSYTFANNFNHSLTKKRITMMCKKKSNPWMRSKVLYAVPMVALALSAFATPTSVTSTEKAAEPGGIPYIDEGKVTNNFSIYQTDKQGKKAIMLDGKEISEEEMNGIDPATIDHVTVVKKNAKSILGRDCDELIVIETTEYAKNKDDDKVFDVCDKLPEYEGGQEGLMNLLQTNVRYPKIAQDMGVQGRIAVEFVVEKDGSVSDVKVCKKDITPPQSQPLEGTTVTAYGESKTQPTEKELRAATKALEEEAIRVVRLTSGKWTHGEQDGQKVRVKFSLPITFRLQ